MRTTVRLSEDILRRAKKRAAEEQRTLTSLLEEGLRAVLSPQKLQSQAPLSLPVSTRAGGTLPGVDLNRSSDLEDRMNNL